jgi:hypothetical protein
MVRYAEPDYDYDAERRWKVAGSGALTYRSKTGALTAI